MIGWIHWLLLLLHLVPPYPWQYTVRECIHLVCRITAAQLSLPFTCERKSTAFKLTSITLQAEKKARIVTDSYNIIVMSKEYCNCSELYCVIIIMTIIIVVLSICTHYCLTRSMGIWLDSYNLHGFTLLTHIIHVSEKGQAQCEQMVW